jgi:hypothetical protein
MLRYYIPLFFIVLFASSCEVFSPQEEIPAYIFIPAIAVNIIDPQVQGTASQNIADAWVSVNDEPIGAFQLPAVVPIGIGGESNFVEGDNEVSVRAGIKINGISATRLEYPSLQAYKTTINLKVGETDTLVPVVEYYPNEKFDWIEGFESPGLTLEESNDSDTNLIRLTNSSDVFEGNASAFFALSHKKQFFECRSTNTYSFPRINNSVFLELNYKADIPFIVGVFANSVGTVSQQSIVTINPKSTWNKIYINITPHVVAAINANVIDFTFFIGSRLNTEETQPDSTYRVYLDNLKLVY